MLVEGSGSHTVGLYYNENQPNPSDPSLSCHSFSWAQPWGLMGHDVVGSSWFRRPVAMGQDSLYSHRHLADSPGGSRLWDVIYFQYLVFYFPFPTMTNSPPLA